MTTPPHPTAPARGERCATDVMGLRCLHPAGHAGNHVGRCDSCGTTSSDGTPGIHKRDCEWVAALRSTPTGTGEAVDGETLLAECLKPEEIAGPAREDRIRELLRWFVRLAEGRANPKWLRAHAFELAYALHSAREEAARLGRELDEARALAYAPGDWICDTCGYVESRRVLNAHDGSVTASEVPALPCPNDGQYLRRLTWRELAQSAQQRALEEIEARQKAERQRIDDSDTIRELREQLAGVREDSARLDWLDRIKPTAMGFTDVSLFCDVDSSKATVRAATYRAAIDAARSVAGQEG